MSDKVIELSLEAAFSIMDEKIKNGGEVAFSPKGTSMLPLIKPFCDTVTLKKPSYVRKGDIVFYRRDNGKFILHRIIRKEKGGLVTCGDNQGFPEKNVKEEQIIAVVTKITHNKKEVSFDSFLYKAYVKTLMLKRFWLRCRSLRYTRAVLRRVKKLFKK